MLLFWRSGPQKPIFEIIKRSLKLLFKICLAKDISFIKFSMTITATLAIKSSISNRLFSHKKTLIFWYFLKAKTLGDGIDVYKLTWIRRFSLFNQIIFSNSSFTIISLFFHTNFINSIKPFFSRIYLVTLYLLMSFW
jgi:hypothetical protein